MDNGDLVVVQGKVVNHGGNGDYVEVHGAVSRQPYTFNRKDIVELPETLREAERLPEPEPAAEPPAEAVPEPAPAA